MDDSSTEYIYRQAIAQSCESSATHREVRSPSSCLDLGSNRGDACVYAGFRSKQFGAIQSSNAVPDRNEAPNNLHVWS